MPNKLELTEGMLLQLPEELIYCIASYLPTLSCLHSLAQTCHHLNRIISADNYRIFQAFVQGRFPSIATPPLWRDAACALASRSRAFDRRAIIGRFVLPPKNATRIGHPRTIRTDHPTLGYRPVVDSYETWYGNNWTARKEVLAWGAGADLVIRVKDMGQENGKLADLRGKGNKPTVNGSGAPKASYDRADWVIFNDLHGVDSWDDISGVHLLGPSEVQGPSEGEELVFGRRNGALVRMSISAAEGSSALKKRYHTGGHKLENTDISTGPDRVLAASLDRRSIAFFKLDAEGDEVHPFAELKTIVHGSARNRCSKLLCDEQIAVGSDGEADKISIFSFSPDSTTKLRDMKVENDDEDISSRKAKVTTIAPLPVSYLSGAKSGTTFLSGWEDSRTRLHDLRSPKPYVSVFNDTVDDSPTYSLLPIGNERFIIGSGVNALVKIFDMRMPGRYCYSEAAVPTLTNPSSPTTSKHTNDHHKSPHNHHPKNSYPYPRRDISIFLSNRIPSTHARTWANTQPRRYRGPVYAISHPSPSSSTLYVGVEDNIVRLDMACTDDLLGPHGNWHTQNLSSPLDSHLSAEYQPFDLSCYERPLPEDRGRGVRLMMQGPYWEKWEDREHHRINNGDAKVDGWDERWFQPWITRSQKLKGPWRRR